MGLTPGCRVRALLLSGVCLASACSTALETPTPIAPTAIPTAAPTSAPTVAPSIPTIQPIPTVAVPVATVKPTATPIPPHSPLSGRPVASADALDRRPLIVKIDNARGARPQSGLAEADIVYETLTEGDVTRFTAVYLAADPDPLGPIRSARLTDLDIPYQYDGILVHVGASAPVIEQLRGAKFADLDLYFSGPFYRASDRPSPHNVFSSAKSLREYGEKRGWGQPSPPRGYPLYWGEPPPLVAGKPATYVDFNYARWSRSEYVFDAERGGYLRSSDGAPHLDQTTGEQLLARNLIVQFVRSWASNIVLDVNGARSTEFELTGEGKGLLFRDGEVAPIKWVRKAKTDLTQFYDERGQPATFKPGNVWIHLVDQNFPVEYR